MSGQPSPQAASQGRLFRFRLPIAAGHPFEICLLLEQPGREGKFIHHEVAGAVGRTKRHQVLPTPGQARGLDADPEVTTRVWMT